ncbi:MAG: low affinity iron permease family protein [Caulobacteraceae bacterium]|nr:low affinity iron permease family protein [Caulobacteraceae bacterium]
MLGKILTWLGVQTSRPTAFLLAGAYAVVWFGLRPQDVGFHEVATMATWMMTLFIQRAEHRDTQAMHAKIDELIRSQQGARNGLTHIDQREPEEIEAERGTA